MTITQDFKKKNSSKKWKKINYMNIEYMFNFSMEKKYEYEFGFEAFHKKKKKLKGENSFLKLFFFFWIGYDRIVWKDT